MIPTPFLKIHQRLLPQRDDIGISPYINLIFLSLFFGNLYFYPVTGVQVLYTVLGLILFLTLYFRAHWASDRELSVLIALVILVAVALSEINLGASIIFVYAASLCGLYTSQKLAKTAMWSVVLFVIAYSLLTLKSSYFWIPAIFMSMSIGLLNLNQIVLNKSREEVSALAKIAERERISRDLHDLLGHSLSVITLKAELAGKMIEKEKPLAMVKQEIESVEHLSRDTLAQVRDAVKGYNQATIKGELLQAKVALDAAGISLIKNIQAPDLPVNVESEIALILREAITNVIRHAETEKVWVTITEQGEDFCLTISDEGSWELKEINAGIRNMESRVNSLQGTLSINSTPSTQLRFIIPKSNSKLKN